MRSTWIFQVGPRVDNKCLFRRGAENKDSPVKMEVKVGAVLPQPRNAWGHQKVEETRKKYSLEPLEHTWSCLIFGLLASTT